MTAGTKIKATTINNELTMFRACLNYSVNTGKNEGKIPKFKVGNTNTPKDRWLTNDELDRLMLVAQGHFKNTFSPMYIWLAIARGTGKRKRVIETLQWEQVNFDTRRIDFRQKGKAESSKKKGLSTMPEWLRTILLEAYNQRTNSYVMGGQGQRNSCFKRIARTAGFHDVSMHTVRHSFGTLLAQEGSSLLEIAEAMGISEKTAARNYIHHCEDFQKRVMAKVAAPAGPGQITLRDKAWKRTRIGARKASKDGHGVGI